MLEVAVGLNPYEQLRSGVNTESRLKWNVSGGAFLWRSLPKRKLAPDPKPRSMYLSDLPRVVPRRAFRAVGRWKRSCYSVEVDSISYPSICYGFRL